RVQWKRLAAVGKEARPYMRDVKRELAIAVACGVGAVIMAVARPWPIKMVFDYALLPAGRVKWVFPYAMIKGYGPMGVVTISCILLLVVTLLWGTFVFTQRFLVAAAGQRVTFRIRRQLFSHLQRLSLSFHRQQRVGDILLRATGDANMMRDMMVDAVLIIFTEFLVLFAMVLVMFWMDWQLTMIALSVIPLLGLIVFRISSSLRTAVRKQRKTEGRVASMVGEMLQSIPVIQVFGREAHEDEKFGASNRQNLKQGLRTVKLEANLERASEIVVALGTGGVLWFGVRRVLAGILTPGDLLVFTSYLASMYRPLRKIARVTGRLSKATVCADRVFSVLRSEEHIRVRHDAAKAPRFEGRVTFKDVAFEYRKGVRVLNDVSFTVKPGRTVAIVGANGAGKSTLCGLLPRLYDPLEGTITIDGEKINRFTPESLREQIGMVLQSPLLFAGTIGENIAYGKLGATREEIIEAAKMADAHDYISQLRDGYDTIVGERGDTLSGGQRQKISIARAMIKKPSILILDEPTSALDASSAAQLNHTLAKLSEGTTTFRVGHRLSELCRSDMIVVFEDGRVSQIGKHDELVRQDGWYRRIFTLQTGIVDGPAAGLPEAQTRMVGGGQE
ncbi:MAG: ABC transporter ATP-binding protein, partial [Candidatus Binatia bacterium]